MADQIFLIYNKETADAIKKAAKLPPQSEGDSYYKPVDKQTMLPRTAEKVEAGGSLQLLKITTPPNGGSGAATGKLITVNSDGTYTESDSEVAVICLALE
jgi:hypothetical protein